MEKSSTPPHLSLKELILISRPFSWVNTSIPFFIGYLLAKPVLDLNLIVGFIYFCIFYNLLLYGVNDIYDYESDLKNPRKNSKEGAVVDKLKHRLLWYSIISSNLGFIIYFFSTGSLISSLFLLVVICLCLTYSIRPLRFKEIPFLDSINSSLHFVSPLVFGLLYGQAHYLPWPAIIAFIFWGMASQALGAIQDIKPDKKANIKSIATQFGIRFTSNYSLSLYILSCLIIMVAYFPWGALASLILAVYPLNVIFFKKYRSDAKAYEFHRAWQNFLWLNWIAGFWLSQLLLIILDPLKLGISKIYVLSTFLIIIAILQTSLIFYNYRKFHRPKTQRISDLPHIDIIMYAESRTEDISSTLLALIGQNYPHFDVYLANLDNDQKINSIVKGYQDPRIHNVEILKPPKNWHRMAWASQQLLNKTSSEIIVLMDAEVILLPNCLSIIASMFSQESFDLISLLPADQTKSFWQQLIMSQEHYFLLGLYPAAILTQHFPKSATAYSSLVAFTRKAINRINGFDLVKRSPLEEHDIANKAKQKGLETAFYIAADIALSQSRTGFINLLNQNTQKLYPNLHFNMPLTIALVSGGIFLLVFPIIFLVILLLVGIYEGTILLSIAVFWLLVNRLVITIRSKQSIIGGLLYPIGSLIMLLFLFNSMLHYEYRKPRWQTRTEL